MFAVYCKAGAWLVTCRCGVECNKGKGYMTVAHAGGKVLLTYIARVLQRHGGACADCDLVPLGDRMLALLRLGCQPARRHKHLIQLRASQHLTAWQPALEVAQEVSSCNPWSGRMCAFTRLSKMACILQLQADFCCRQGKSEAHQRLQ